MRGGADWFSALQRIRITPENPPADYDVVIEPGVLDTIGAVVRDVAAPHTCVIISDDRVGALYGDRVAANIRGAGIESTLLTFPAGEANKTLATWQSLTERMLQHGVGRDCCVVALGGGVAGDVAGFVAAAYMRGLPFVQVPTSVVAMIDSSIGGKTGVDTQYGKNLVGAFHQPRVVLVDPTVLLTLPENELRGGMAEALKHGAIANADYLRWLSESVGAIERGSMPEVTRMIRGSVEIKADFVARDVHEAGPRAALNFGHTIGHAIERVSEYTVSHGEAVAIGMCLEARCGEIAGVTAPGTEAELRRIVAAYGLPTDVPAGMSADAVVESTRSDKKARRGRSRYTLISRLGATACSDDGAWTHELNDDLVRGAIAE